MHIGCSLEVIGVYLLTCLRDGAAAVCHSASRSYRGSGSEFLLIGDQTRRGT